VYLRWWYQENLIRVPTQLCSDSYTTLHGLCTTFPWVLYDLFYDPTILSYQTVESLIYNLRYGSAGLFSLSKSRSSPLSAASTILGVFSSSKYISYSSSIGSSQFMTKCCLGFFLDLLYFLIEPRCYAPSSIFVFLGYRGHTCCPHVMLLFLVPVPDTFLLLSSSDIPLAIMPCNKVAPYCMPHGGPSTFYLLQP